MNSPGVTLSAAMFLSVALPLATHATHSRSDSIQNRSELEALIAHFRAGQQALKAGDYEDAVKEFDAVLPSMKEAKPKPPTPWVGPCCVNPRSN